MLEAVAKVLVLPGIDEAGCTFDRSRQDDGEGEPEGCGLHSGGRTAKATLFRSHSVRGENGCLVTKIVSIYVCVVKW